jgi:glycerate kinase
VYGPQKGATRAQVELLRRRLRRLADEYEQRTGIAVMELEHGGAAGGLAGGLAVLGARLESGFDVVADAAGLDDALAAADIVITGEGRFDATSLEGKVTGSVIALAEEHGVDAIAVIAGEVTDDARAAIDDRPVLALSLLERAWDRDEAFARAGQLLEEAAVEAVRSWT